MLFRSFREQDMDCSSAHIIEASRLATSLAALRERPRPGLPELYEALQTTVCMGDSAPLRLIERQLIVGDKLGTIPETAPTVPLQRDLEQAACLREKVGAHMSLAVYRFQRQEWQQAQLHLEFVLEHANKLYVRTQAEEMMCKLPADL